MYLTKPKFVDFETLTKWYVNIFDIMFLFFFRTT